ncbi:MAG: uroporphyrinogen-III C-methyltransferase [Phycisphaera sp.]|nr:uroporphyrinogen-III C-methyltransferase [Phycisphaera sp.]
MSDKEIGIVYLVGAGPGDPELITLKALRCIEAAEVLVFDALANPVLLEYAAEDCELIDAGKRAKDHKLTQDETNALLAEHALAGKIVVRLKGGDPYVFGRGSEEGIYLHERGIPVEIVPGITAAMAGPAYAGIPVTHRNVATTVTFITGHEDPTKDATQTDYRGLSLLAQKGGTLCFYMGMGRLPNIVEELTKHGLSPDTPAGVVQWGTLPKQRSLRAPLNELADAVNEAGLGAPAIIIVGPVCDVDTDHALDWFEHRPLFGQTVVITRTRHQASALRQELEDLGATVLEAPTIEIVEPDDRQRHMNRTYLDQLADGKFDWLILTSVNGVWAMKDEWEQLDLDSRWLSKLRVATIGDATADAFEQEFNIRPDLVPTKFVAESLAAELIAAENMKGKRVLMLRADIARPLLREKLEAAGAEVVDAPVYITQQAASLPEDVVEAIRDGVVDWITFTSSSTVSNFVELLGKDRAALDRVKVASIGPITSNTVRELGLTVTTEADPHTIPGLVDALVDAVAASRG